MKMGPSWDKYYTAVWAEITTGTWQVNSLSKNSSREYHTSVHLRLGTVPISAKRYIFLFLSFKDLWTKLSHVVKVFKNCIFCFHLLLLWSLFLVIDECLIIRHSTLISHKKWHCHWQFLLPTLRSSQFFHFVRLLCRTTVLKFVNSKLSLNCKTLCFECYNFNSNHHFL